MRDARMNSLKALASFKGQKMCDIAEIIGIHPSTLCVWFRKYNAEHYQKIMDAINQLEGSVPNDEVD